MKANKITIIIALTMIFILVGVIPAGAKAERIEWAGVECTFNQGPPARYWESDGLIHFRGAEWKSEETTDNNYLTGINTLQVNFDFNPVTGEGHAYGTFSLKPAMYNGTWEGNWSTHISPSGINGFATGQGNGDLSGMRIFNYPSNTNPNDPCNISSGIILIP